MTQTIYRWADEPRIWKQCEKFHVKLGSGFICLHMMEGRLTRLVRAHRTATVAQIAEKDNGGYYRKVSNVLVPNTTAHLQRRDVTVRNFFPAVNRHYRYHLYYHRTSLWTLVRLCTLFLMKRTTKQQYNDKHAYIKLYHHRLVSQPASLLFTWLVKPVLRLWLVRRMLNWAQG